MTKIMLQNFSFVVYYFFITTVEHFSFEKKGSKAKLHVFWDGLYIDSALPEIEIHNFKNFLQLIWLINLAEIMLE